MIGALKTIGVDEEAWRSEGLCAQTDPDSFFPDKGESTRTAKEICGRCDVRQQCLEYALKNDERFGVWGGHSPRDRRRLKQLELLRSACDAA